MGRFRDGPGPPTPARSPRPARPGRRSQAPRARPRGLALAPAPWPARRALEAEKMWSVSRGHFGPVPPSPHCGPKTLKKKVQSTSQKRTHRRSLTRDHATEPSHTLASSMVPGTKSNSPARAQHHCCHLPCTLRADVPTRSS